MKTNRILSKSNKEGFQSETTESNEHLRIRLGFLLGTLAILARIIH
jgi:hypothetical protein